MNSDELIKLIEDVFPPHPMPEHTLRQVTLSDQGISRKISDEEWESAGRIDRDVPWTALSDQDLIECRNGIAHLTGAEFAYYMAALLRFGVRHLEAGIWTSEGELVGAILYSVTDDSHPITVDYVHARWASLNAAQIAVVRKFLEHVAVRSEQYGADASKALVRYWNAAKPAEPNYCPVCSYVLPTRGWRAEVASVDMCPCCGIRFGVDDMAGGYLVRRTIYDHWRAQWIGAGMPWRSASIPKPEGWDPAVQIGRLKGQG